MNKVSKEVFGYYSTALGGFGGFKVGLVGRLDALERRVRNEAQRLDRLEEYLAVKHVHVGTIVQTTKEETE